VPVKRVQSFQFYGADALPKPGRKGGSSEGWRVPMGEGFTWAILYCPMFLHWLSYHWWSSGQHSGLISRRIKDRISIKSKKKFQINRNF
jgi:hypothetical protein